MNKRILIVDDDINFVNKILNICNNKKYSFSIADSIKRALMYITDDKFDLILANVKVPGGSCVELKKSSKINLTDTSFLFMSDLDSDYSYVNKIGEKCCHKYELESSLKNYFENA